MRITMLKKGGEARPASAGAGEKSYDHARVDAVFVKGRHDTTLRPDARELIAQRSSR